MFKLDPITEQQLNEARPEAGTHMVMVTGHLARSGLERVMKAIDPQDFTYEIQECDVQVAAWITTSMIAEQIKSYEHADMILVPGKVTGDVRELSDEMGIPVLKGPACYSELPVFFEVAGIEQIDDEDIIKPRILVVGPVGSHRGKVAEFMASTYRVPHISRVGIIKDALKEGDALARTAKSYMENGETIPHNLVSEMVRSRFIDPDVTKGYVLEGYPSTAREVQWVNDLNLKPDVIIRLDVPLETALSRAVGQGKPEDIMREKLERDFEALSEIDMALESSPLVKRIDASGDTQTVMGNALAEVETMMQQCLVPDEGMANEKD